MDSVKESRSNLVVFHGEEVASSQQSATHHAPRNDMFYFAHLKGRFLNNIMSDITILIPQKPPFVMVDKLLSCNENVTITSFHVLADNIMVCDGEFTEGGLMENMAQTAAARAGYMTQSAGASVKDGYIASVKNFEVFQLPKVGDKLLTEIKITDQVFDMTMICGTITCNNIVQAKCEMSIFEGK